MESQNDVKQNESVFNDNGEDNGGFLYTTNASFSSLLAKSLISKSIFSTQFIIAASKRS